MPEQSKLDLDIEENFPHSRFSRRQFLWRLSVLASGSLLAACQVRENDLGFRSYYEDVMISAEPVPEEAAAAATDERNLENFLALSAVLTGFDRLNPQLGQLYLESLQANPEMAMTPAELYEQAGFTGGASPTLEAFNEAGLFDDEASRQLADKIIEYWYTGVYDQGGEQVVASTTEALAWQALAFTKPITLCGGTEPDFWEERPETPMPLVTQVNFGEEEASGGN